MGATSQRAVPRRWEDDLIIGLDRSAIGTLVERSSRFTMPVHLPRKTGCGLIPRGKVILRWPAMDRSQWPKRSRHRDGTTGRTVAIINLGSWQRTIRSRPPHHRVRGQGLLRRSQQSMAVRHERECEWPPATILPKGHSPILVVCPRDRAVAGVPERSGRSPSAEHKTPKNARLKDARRSLKRIRKI